MTEKTQVIAIANAGAADDVTSTINSFDGDGAFGALSTFGTRNPIYYQMNGAGLGINQDFGFAQLSLAYLASEANNPSEGNGIFNGPYGALAQLTIKPSDRFTVGLTYINSYNQTLAAGSNAANLNSPIPTLLGLSLADLEVPVSTNSYGVQANFSLGSTISLGGWVGYTTSRTLSTLGGLVDRGDFSTWNYAVTLGLADIGSKGSVLGFIAGMEPKVTSSSIDELPEDRDTSYHLEAFYQYRASDNITITPGVIWLTAPDHNDDNDDVVTGVVRTTFSF